MDLLLSEWLAVEPPLGEPAVRTTVRTALAAWKSLPPPVVLETAGAVEDAQERMPERWRTRYAEELAALERDWDAMRQAIADKHVTVYEFKNRVVGYVFCGAQNDDRMTLKWIVCGSPQFVEDYQNVQKEHEEQAFNKKYERVQERTPYREVDALDDQFKAHRYQRVCKFSAPKKDSGWIKL